MNTRTLNVLLLLCTVLPSSCRVPEPAIQVRQEAIALVADLRVHLNQASDLSNQAVMATTDEASQNLANKAQDRRKQLRQEVEALTPKLKALSDSTAQELMARFSVQLGLYEKIDDEILRLAVENSNLKAQRLSFIDVPHAVDAFDKALTSVVSNAVPQKREQAEKLACQASLTIRDIHTLLAPHIAEPTDAVMSKLEEQISSRELAIENTLSKIKQLLPAQTTESQKSAWNAYRRFKDLTPKDHYAFPTEHQRSIPCSFATAKAASGIHLR